MPTPEQKIPAHRYVPCGQNQEVKPLDELAGEGQLFRDKYKPAF